MRLILLVALWAFALGTFVPFVFSKTIFGQNQNDETNRIQKKPVQNMEHHTFFNSLTREEKMWLMKISVMFADDDIELFPEFPSVEQPEIPSVEQPEDSKEGPSKSKRKAPSDFIPFPIDDETPLNLMAGLLNGQIPKEFQRGFTHWIKEQYNVTQKHFKYAKMHGGYSFCPPQTTNCPEFGDIGAECCPFG